VATPRRLLLHRVAVAAVLLAAVALLGVVRDLGGPALRLGEPAPEDVFATREVRVVDEDATLTARRAAAESVDAVVLPDPEAQRAILADLRAVFAAVREVRAPVEVEVEGGAAGGAGGGAADPADPDGAGPALRLPSGAEQRVALAARLPGAAAATVSALVAATDGELDLLERETIAIGQQLARQRIPEDAVATVLAETLTVELGLRSLPRDTGGTVVGALLERTLRPTVAVDLEATAAARERAAAAAPEVVGVWRTGEVVVRAGELVGPLEAAAIAQLDLGGTSRWRLLAVALAAAGLVVVLGGVLLARMHPLVWGSPKRMWALALLLVAFATTVLGVDLLAETAGGGWAFLVPAGALGSLVALTLGPGLGIAVVLPTVLLVLLLDPEGAAVATYAAASVLLAVPLSRGIESRSGLRAALVRGAVAAPALAGVGLLLLDVRADVPTALLAALIGGGVSAVVVQGALPWIESAFRLPTVTALLDLADRNHPLLRELELKALGSYNHSVMVAALTERACRAIGADPLLGSVAALYHDIGKVRQPHYFIENQQGIANPHDGLEPEVSALIIISHVVDGVELATTHRLPPEVVACIGSHHGTMRVKYFHDRAVAAAGGDASAVDEAAFRYRGTRPRGREAAVLLLADSCEATTRALAMTRGTLPRDEIEATVDGLLEERLADGQFDASEITLRDLRVVRDSLVESLVGIYHPRIAYPRTAADAR
jgi:putative nucleotidyltransferase with HDIG domain